MVRSIVYRHSWLKLLVYCCLAQLDLYQVWYWNICNNNDDDKIKVPLYARKHCRGTVQNIKHETRIK
jgi:hypothetical protein